MPRLDSDVAELFAETAEDCRWSRPKQIEILLGFIDEQGLEAELFEYLRACNDDDDVESEDDDNFDEE